MSLRAQQNTEVGSHDKLIKNGYHLNTYSISNLTFAIETDQICGVLMEGVGGREEGTRGGREGPGR